MSEATKKDDVILQVNDLHVSFKSYAGYVRAVRGVDFNALPAEVKRELKGFSDQLR